MFTTLLGISVGYILLYHQLICWRRPYLVAVNDEEDRVSSKLFETLQAGKILKLEQACGLAMKPLRQSYMEYARGNTSGKYRCCSQLDQSVVHRAVHGRAACLGRQ